MLVSLARAGTPVGILIKHYIEKKLGRSAYHYTISIIRGKGIDKNAMSYILVRHSPESIQFVDGWTGKGAIQRELSQAMKDYPNVSAGLAVLSDPAGMPRRLEHMMISLIASSCLNSTVSGLLSRTFYRSDIIGPTDFHGAAFYKELLSKDLTYTFINAVESCFPDVPSLLDEGELSMSGMDEVKLFATISISKTSTLSSQVLVKQLAFCFVVCLGRSWFSLDDYEHLGHLYQLAFEKGIQLEEYPLKTIVLVV